ncbi:hypothetical protein [Microterricola gilva]|nr:hypothetical protein [Microterricola gilva]
MQTTTGLEQSLNTDALTRRVRRRDVKRFFRAFSSEHPAVGSRLEPAQRFAWGVVVVIIVIGLFAMAFGVTREIAQGAPDMVSQLIGMCAVGGLMLVAAIVIVWVLVRVTVRRGTPKRHYRLAHFAADNGLSYEPGPTEGDHVTPWADRGQLTLSRVIRPSSERAVEFANYRLRYGPAGSQDTQFGGYCAVRLATPLPHIVVLAQGGAPRALTGLAVPASAQRLSLEGDFDEHFSLYCPEGYERDALYLFTPDVMARLIDDVHGFDIEIIDDWLFLVNNTEVVTLDPADWVGLMDAVAALGAKLERWERWRDDRIDQPERVPASSPQQSALWPAAAGAGVVAKPGQRLRRGKLRGFLIWFLPMAVLLAAGIISQALQAQGG